MVIQENIRGQQAASTRAALIAAARRLFAEKGYHATSTNDVVEATGLTRGALYHHFADKEGLFEAVFRETEADLQDAAGRAVRKLYADPWLQLQEGMKAYLQIIAANKDMQRILLLDGPSVFGWLKWRTVESEFTLRELEAALRRSIDAGLLRRQDVSAPSHLIQAALNEAALLIAHAANPETTRLDVTRSLLALVTGLRNG
jgi:AcrR family transcriptional regulator